MIAQHHHTEDAISDQNRNIPDFVRFLLFLILLYLFFVSISLMGAAFKFFGKDFAETLLTTTASPFVGLFVGILATSLIQSSSTVSSLTVGLVAAGALTLDGAIPIIFGANIGTSITNTLVATGHIYRPEEFRRAFAASTVHDFFNILAVIVLFPLQLATNFLGISSSYVANTLARVGGLEMVDPLKVIVKPAVAFIAEITAQSGILMLVIAIGLLFIALRYIVLNLKVLVIGKVEAFFDQTLFKTAARALVVGLIITVLVQSSSISTSLVIPLAGAGILTLRQIFPFTLGANIGTTITAMLAALVTQDVTAIAVAFSHLFFNVTGIVVFWPMRQLPIYLAEQLALYSLRSKLIPIVYIVIVFFLIPLSMVYFLG